MTTPLIYRLTRDHSNWFEDYKAAILETDAPKVRAKLLIVENKIGARLRVLAQDGGGTEEERKSIAIALNGIKTLRSEISGWSQAVGGNES